MWTGLVGGGNSGCGFPGLIAKERIERTGGIERGKVVDPADMPIIDIDLRNRAPARARHHFRPPGGLQIDANLLDVPDAFALQQPFGSHAIGAHCRAIHADARRHFSTGMLACCQAPMPPARTTTSAKPAFLSIAVAACDRPPAWQSTTAGRGLNFASSPMRFS